MGNQVDFSRDGEGIRASRANKGQSYSLPGYEKYYQEGVTWSQTTGGGVFSARIHEQGTIHDTSGPTAFSVKNNSLACLLNSKPIDMFLRILNPTLHYQAGNIADLPLPKNFPNPEICDLGQKIISLSRKLWDSQEESWGFSGIPWISNELKGKNTKVSFLNWDAHCIESAITLKKLEEENNRFFIEAYSLQDELSPEVPEDQITLARADREKDSQRLISYAIGCMMGRYSLDEPGLIYAHAGNIGFDASRYKTFPADSDGILPLTDEHWFDDDAAQRISEFLLAVWGPETLNENMAWLAASLAPKSHETPQETLRRYLADKFFKDHLQTYKKRPIYWLFSSGKQGAFQALVYLHRYHEGTLARMRNQYVIPLAGKIAGRIEFLEQEVANAPSTAARNKAQKHLDAIRKKQAELAAYDEQLRHYSDRRISLDLDDGVKVNYGKFGNLLAEVKAVTGGSADD